MMKVKDLNRDKFSALFYQSGYCRGAVRWHRAKRHRINGDVYFENYDKMWTKFHPFFWKTFTTDINVLSKEEQKDLSK